MRKICLFACLYLSVCLSVVAGAETLYERIAANSDAKNLGEFDVVSVIDGDTIIIKQKTGKTPHIRLIGVNAPETKEGLDFRGDKAQEEQPFAGKAKNFVQDAIKASGNKVELYREGREKSYERFLCWVIVKTPDGKRELGELLVAAGLGTVYKDKKFIPDEKEREILAELEKKAKAGKKGIWGDKLPDDNKVAGAGQSQKLKAWLKQNKFSNVHSQGKYGWSPLHLAASQCRTDIAELLLANGAKVDAKDINDWTPLHRVSRNGCKDIADLLIAKGADVNARTDHDKTPLRLAEDDGNANIAELLRQHGGIK
jgi:endonuclease YncB( thermonuclease family)